VKGRVLFEQPSNMLGCRMDAALVEEPKRRRLQQVFNSLPLMTSGLFCHKWGVHFSERVHLKDECL
ncbi:MAG: hypothetical protein AAGA25_15035, partial [Planctomycetota bacterium]